MEFKEYARRPFVIEAVQVTKKNIAEVAAMGVGTLDRTEKGALFIKVNPRVVPHVSRVYPGFWFTRTENGQIRCYLKRIFNEQYTELDDAAHFALVPYMRAEAIDVEEGEVKTNVFVDPPVKHPKSLEELEAEKKAEIEAETGDKVENIFTEPQVEEIPPGGTYTPGQLSPRTTAAAPLAEKEARRVQ